MKELDALYFKKLKIRQEETRLTDPVFMYDKEQFTNFLKSFYNNIVHNHKTGLIELAKNLVVELVKNPNLVLAFMFFSREEHEGTFINFYKQRSGRIIELTDISISKNAIEYLDETVAIDCLNKL